MTASTTSRRGSRLGGILGVALLLVAWQVGAWLSHPLIIPSPASTACAILEMIRSGEIIEALGISVQRAGTGLLVGMAVGTALGMAGGLIARLDDVMRPLVAMILSTPNMIFVVMAMVWFGMGSGQVIFVVALMVVPIMYLSTRDSLRSIDESLLEMARVFRLPPVEKVRRLYVPSLALGLFGGLMLSVTTALRVTIFAELLGAQDGVGPAIGMTRSYMETDKLFAWAVVMIVVVVLIEALAVRPIEKRMARWRG